MRMEDYRQAMEREIRVVQARERRMERAAHREHLSSVAAKGREKIPDNVQSALEEGFTQGFRAVFRHGFALLKRTYCRDEIAYNEEEQRKLFDDCGVQKGLAKVRKTAKAHYGRELLATTAEGAGLGLLGIGLPDIVLFCGFLMRGLSMLAIRYGCDPDSPEERMLMLKMIEAALAKGKAYEKKNNEVDNALCWPETLLYIGEKAQIKKTAKRLAQELLALKFVQGIPVAGILAAPGNPVCYHKIMTYARVKYYKRYLRQMTPFSMKEGVVYYNGRACACEENEAGVREEGPDAWGFGTSVKRGDYVRYLRAGDDGQKKWRCLEQDTSCSIESVGTRLEIVEVDGEELRWIAYTGTEL